MTEPNYRELAAELDALAWCVARLLDDGDDVAALAITTSVQRRAGVPESLNQPVGPVIGRQFAHAHTLLLKAHSLRATQRRSIQSAESGYAA